MHGDFPAPVTRALTRSVTHSQNQPQFGPTAEIRPQTRIVSPQRDQTACKDGSNALGRNRSHGEDPDPAEWYDQAVMTAIILPPGTQGLGTSLHIQRGQPHQRL